MYPIKQIIILIDIEYFKLLMKCCLKLDFDQIAYTNESEVEQTKIGIIIRKSSIYLENGYF